MHLLHTHLTYEHDEAYLTGYTNPVETERADRSASFCVTDESGRVCPTIMGRHSPVSRTQNGFSHIFVTAAVSLVALVAVVGWQISNVIREHGDATSYVAAAEPKESDISNENPLAGSTLFSTESGTTPIGSAVLDGLVAKYFALQEQGLYTPEVAAKTAEKMAEGLVAPAEHRTYTAADISTAADTSYARMIAYRNDLQVSLAPLLKNTEPEYELFAYYVSTKDKKHLEKLQTAAQNYRAAAQATARVVPPKDALSHHLGILNSLEEFAAALDALIANAEDPFAAVVVLRSYNQAETGVLTSFASLAKYYREKRS